MLSRRGFLGRMVAAAVTLCGGASAIAAPVRKQISSDIKLYRVTSERLSVIDWFDQKVGDCIIGVWKNGKCESWTVTGEPYWSEPTGFPVETVQMEDNRAYGEFDTVAGVLYNPSDGSITGKGLDGAPRTSWGTRFPLIIPTL